MNSYPVWYEILDRDPSLYIPVILILVGLFYHLLNPVYTGTIYKKGDNVKPRWEQIAYHEPNYGFVEPESSSTIYSKTAAKSKHPNAIDLSAIAAKERGEF